MRNPALTPEATDAAAADILAWLRELRVEIPVPEPVILRWTDAGCEEIPMADYDEDSEDLWIDPDQPTLEDVARGVVGMVERHARVFPGPRSWRRSKVALRVLCTLYAAGLIAGYGYGSDGMDPHGTWLIESVAVRGKRPYVLFRSRDWWACQRLQGFHLRRHAYRDLHGLCVGCYPDVSE
jgi:hypothetical protein